MFVSSIVFFHTWKIPAWKQDTQAKLDMLTIGMTVGHAGKSFNT